MQVQTEQFRAVEAISVQKISRSNLLSFYLAITAGIFISIAFVFYLTVTAGSTTLPEGLMKLLGGIVFSLGLVLVALCGGELFTSSVLSTGAWANNQLNSLSMFKRWALIYLGNLIGATLFVLLVWGAELHFSLKGEWGMNALKVASSKIEHSFTKAFCLGVLCNLMVCLAIWMSYSCKTITEKILVIVFPISMFVACGFEHCIANMFLIPMAIVIQQCASPEFWKLIGAAPDQFEQLNIYTFLESNLIPVTLGNIVGGGVLVGLGYFQIHRVSEDPQIDEEK